MSEIEQDPIVADVVARARKSGASNSAQRKHHLVPRFYLKRWEVDGVLRVTDIDTQKTYTVPAKKAARETDFYSLADDRLDPDELPPLLFETVLGDLEADAAAILDKILTSGLGTLSETEGSYFATFMAFQVVRGRTFREEADAQYNLMQQLQFTGWSDAAIRKRMREVGMEATPENLAMARDLFKQVETGEVFWAGSPGHHMALGGKTAEAIGEALHGRRWELWDTPPVLLTSDEPMVVLAGPERDRDHRGGLGDAPVVLFPLSPSRLLVLFRPDVMPWGPRSLDHAEVAEVNREILVNTFRVAFDQPRRHTAERMHVGPRQQVVMEQFPDPEPDGDREIVRLHKSTRWHGDPHAPWWPVARWWW